MNRKFIKLLLLLILASGQPVSAIAESYTVLVKDSFFRPNDLVINVGDTVVWESDSNPRCGPYGENCSATAHTVTADDFSFSSGQPSDDIDFSRDFNDEGEILYHCEEHSAPGQDIITFMNGRITVQAQPPVFKINAGLNDAWYDPVTDGQGFFITVFPDLGVVSLAWFTYDTELPPMDATANLGDPGHRWLTAAGSYADNQAVMNIVLTSDGLFDTPTDVQRTDPPGSDGTLILTFDSCSSGTVEYDIPSIDRQGIVPIQRVADDNIALCEALSAD